MNFTTPFFKLSQKKKCKALHSIHRQTLKIAERVIKTVRSLLKKPVFEKGKADWVSELPSVIKQINNTIHNSTEMTPIQASEKVKKK